MMLPQEASGYFTPRPRKESVASVMMMPPRLIVACTIKSGMTFGTRCRKILRETRMPVASVATMKSCSRSERIWPRTTRAMLVQPNMPSTAMRMNIRLIGSISILSMTVPMIMTIG